jgi:hypothetical protein
MGSKRIPSSGSTYKVESSVKWVKSGHHDTGTVRNEGLIHTGFFSDKDGYETVPEYTENTNPGTGFGGRTKIVVESAPASKRKNAVVSNPQGARSDDNPDWSHSKGLSGPHPPVGTSLTGAGPRHPRKKIVTSTPSSGPKQSRTKDGKLKDSNDTAESMSWGQGYGNRAPVTDPTVRKRSDVVPQDSSLTHDNNNPMKREAAYAGISRTSLKDAEKLGKGK